MALYSLHGVSLRLSTLTEDSSMITVSSCGVKLQEVLSGLEGRLKHWTYTCTFVAFHYEFFLSTWGAIFFFFFCHISNDLQSHWFLPLSAKPKKFEFIHQTISRLEAHVGWAQDSLIPRPEEQGSTELYNYVLKTMKETNWGRHSVTSCNT